MLKKLVLLLVCASGGLSTAFAQQGVTELANPAARLKDIKTGLFEFCLPAQRAGQTASEYEASHRQDLPLSRMQLSNTSQVNAWGFRTGGDVAVMENEAGCTVSMSFWQSDSQKIVPDLRGMLTTSADQYQVVSGDPDKPGSGLVVAFCNTVEPGVVDSWLLYESLGKPEEVWGQRRRERQYVISVVTPTEPFCAQE